METGRPKVDIDTIQGTKLTNPEKRTRKKNELQTAVSNLVNYASGIRENAARLWALHDQEQLIHTQMAFERAETLLALDFQPSFHKDKNLVRNLERAKQDKENLTSQIDASKRHPESGVKYGEAFDQLTEIVTPLEDALKEKLMRDDRWFWVFPDQRDRLAQQELARMLSQARTGTLSEKVNWKVGVDKSRIDTSSYTATAIQRSNKFK